MTADRRASFFKVAVSFERRPDGGLRAWSDDVPGLVLSSRDIDGLLSDIKPALEVILSAMVGAQIEAEPLVDLRAFLEDEGVVDPASSMPILREYVARRSAH